MVQVSEILKLKKEKRAIILAHNYQNPEIQDIADYSGDSLELAKIAASSDAKIIVFCGVLFMAESAYILSPDKKVILPDVTAGCAMADMITVDDVISLKNKHPDVPVVTYVNSSAEVKAVSDICVTSANAISIINCLEAERIIFLPDKNLAQYVQRFTKKNIIYWRGYCPIHENLTKEDVLHVKELYPNACTVVHPECRPEVIDIADFVWSTGQMIKNVSTLPHQDIIIGTEKGIIHRLKKSAPNKNFILASEKLICLDMKKINLEKLFVSLTTEEPVVYVKEEIRIKAFAALKKMLEFS